jgi:feruloyl esterase
VLLCKARRSRLSDCAAGAKRQADLFAARNPRTGEELFSSLVPGTELGWGVRRSARAVGEHLRPVRYVVFKIRSGTGRRSTSTAMSERGTRPENLIMNATDPNMKPFFSHGGKLLLYHGWSDPNVPTLNTIKYYKPRRRRHGRSRKGVQQRPVVSASPAWDTVAAGRPERIRQGARWNSGFEHGNRRTDDRVSPRTVRSDRTRALCPYPEWRNYKGTGSIDDAANFACVAPSLDDFCRGCPFGQRDVHHGDRSLSAGHKRGARAIRVELEVGGPPVSAKD